MELRQLAYFVAVVEEASFTRAAARLHVAQPGVSAQVRRLEREFGVDLLDRSGRAVRLTEVGAAVLPYARAALATVAGARLAADEFAGLVRGQVTVGTVIACASLDLADMLAAFHANHPAVEIRLSEDRSDRLLEALRSARLDLGFVGLPGLPAETPPGIEIQVVADEPLVAAVGRDDTLAGEGVVPLAALRDRRLICLPRGSGLRSSLDAACAEAGFQPRIAFEGSDLRTLAQLAARGLGVAIVPASMAGAHAADLRALSVTEPGMRARVALAWRSGGAAGPAARALIGHARSFLAGRSASPPPSS